MFEEAAIARKDSVSTPTVKPEHVHQHKSERRDSVSPLVGFLIIKLS